MKLSPFKWTGTHRLSQLLISDLPGSQTAGKAFISTGAKQFSPGIGIPGNGKATIVAFENTST